ncbi:MAG: hypothetical protein ACXV8L_09600 [Ilumatobacteraceae bacterium]
MSSNAADVLDRHRQDIRNRWQRSDHERLGPRIELLRHPRRDLGISVRRIDTSDVPCDQAPHGFSHRKQATNLIAV